MYDYIFQNIFTYVLHTYLHIDLHSHLHVQDGCCVNSFRHPMTVIPMTTYVCMYLNILRFVGIVCLLWMSIYTEFVECSYSTLFLFNVLVSSSIRYHLIRVPTKEYKILISIFWIKGLNYEPHHSTVKNLSLKIAIECDHHLINLHSFPK